jgi:hypothetical protein
MTSPVHAWPEPPALLQPEQFATSPAPFFLKKLWMYFRIYLYCRNRYTLLLAGFITAFFMMICFFILPAKAPLIMGGMAFSFLLVVVFLTAYAYRADVQKIHSLAALIRCEWAQRLTLAERLFFCQTMKISADAISLMLFRTIQTPAEAKYLAAQPRDDLPHLPDKKLAGEFKKLAIFFGLSFLKGLENPDWIIYLLNFGVEWKQIYPKPPNAAEKKALARQLKERFNSPDRPVMSDYQDYCHQYTMLYLFFIKYSEYLQSHNISTNFNITLLYSEKLLRKLASHITHIKNANAADQQELLAANLASKNQAIATAAELLSPAAADDGGDSDSYPDEGDDKNDDKRANNPSEYSESSSEYCQEGKSQQLTVAGANPMLAQLPLSVIATKQGLDRSSFFQPLTTTATLAAKVIPPPSLPHTPILPNAVIKVPSIGQST